MYDQALNIVNRNDKITGTEKKSVIHKKGLLHREVHVYFVTSSSEIIFQHRVFDKDTWPNMLDATVGGHVDIDETYEEAAIRETLEETGVRMNKDNFIEIAKLSNISKDEKTDSVNNTIKKEFVYFYDGDIKDLKIEKGKATGFESWSMDSLVNLSDEDKERFIPYIYSFVKNELIDFIKNKKI